MGKKIYSDYQIQEATRLLKQNHTHKEVSFMTGVSLSRVQSLSLQYIGKRTYARLGKIARPRPEDFMVVPVINTHEQMPDGSVKQRLDLSKFTKEQLIYILCNLTWRGTK